MRRYHIQVRRESRPSPADVDFAPHHRSIDPSLAQNRDDYLHYNRLVGHITKLSSMLLTLPASDEFRVETSKDLLEKLFAMGLIVCPTGTQPQTRPRLSSAIASRVPSISDSPLVSQSSDSSLSAASTLTVSAFCRRRLPVVLVTLKMAQTVPQAVKLVEQGNVRVGPTIVNDPAFLVTRSFEDLVTWTYGSKIRRTIETYNAVSYTHLTLPTICSV